MTMMAYYVGSLYFFLIITKKIHVIIYFSKWLAIVPSAYTHHSHFPNILVQAMSSSIATAL